jgi:hypothetical protein
MRCLRGCWYSEAGGTTLNADMDEQRSPRPALRKVKPYPKPGGNWAAILISELPRHLLPTLRRGALDYFEKCRGGFLFETVAFYRALLTFEITRS